MRKPKRVRELEAHVERLVGEREVAVKERATYASLNGQLIADHAHCEHRVLHADLLAMQDRLAEAQQQNELLSQQLQDRSGIVAPAVAS